MVPNFQFSAYLRESPLPESERADLERIFAMLRPERKVEILDAWPKYLAKILEIKAYAEEEKGRLMMETFARIDAILDDATLRANEEAARREREEAERLETVRISAEYDANAKLRAMRNLGRPAEPPPRSATASERDGTETYDPLAQFF